MAQVLWTRYFLEAQGFIVTDNIIYQDNTSTIKLEENGRGSSGKRTRHINIRYFFVTDRVKAEEISVKYCPTEMMLADFYTKPLQGKLFRLFRNLFLNIEDPDMDEYMKKNAVLMKRPINTPQECVVNNAIQNKFLIPKNAEEHTGSTCKTLTQSKGIYRPPLKGMDNDTRSIVNNYQPGIARKLKSLARGYFNRLLTNP